MAMGMEHGSQHPQLLTQGLGRLRAAAGQTGVRLWAFSQHSVPRASFQGIKERKQKNKICPSCKLVFIIQCQSMGRCWLCKHEGARRGSSVATSAYGGSLVAKEIAEGLQVGLGSCCWQILKPCCAALPADLLWVVSAPTHCRLLGFCGVPASLDVVEGIWGRLCLCALGGPGLLCVLPAATVGQPWLSAGLAEGCE